MTLLAIPLLLLSAVGTGYTLFAVRAVDRFARQRPDPAVAAEPATLLKPLHGPEPRLAANLATFLDQVWNAPIELVAGAARRDDPALGLAAGLAQSEDRRVAIVAEAARHGANAKIGNLLNMGPATRHDLIVLSDSDMAVPRDYLAQVAAALARPGAGIVTCLYRGRGDAGRWSVLGAAGISYGFLPSVLVALALGMAPPAMGSTIALRRETLARVGGFRRFADVLADDNALGAAVNSLGLATVVPPVVLTHGCAETSLRAVFAHELRWSATIRAVDRAGHAGLVATFPVPFAIMALAFAPVGGALALAAALLARLWLVARIDRLTGAASAPRWLLVPRDCLSLAVFLGALFARSVEWRGSRLAMTGAGRIAARARP